MRRDTSTAAHWVGVGGSGTAVAAEEVEFRAIPVPPRAAVSVVPVVLPPAAAVVGATANITATIATSTAHLRLPVIAAIALQRRAMIHVTTTYLPLPLFFCGTLLPLHHGHIFDPRFIIVLYCIVLYWFFHRQFKLHRTQ